MINLIGFAAATLTTLSFVPVIAANAATLLLASCQIGLTIRYRRRPDRTAASAGRTKSESTTI